MLGPITPKSLLSADELRQSPALGNYILVTFSIDTTGRRLSDEIFQLAAYTPTTNFQQYILPTVKLNSAARQRHKVHVVVTRGTRTLKSMHTNKILKTEPELVVLKNFLEWLSKLESRHGKPDGIILLYHEEHATMPHMLLHALQKYSMLQEFTKIITCFLNCNDLAKTYMGDQEYKYLGLSKLSLLLSKSKEPPKYKKGCARVRARMVFNVALQLMNRDRKSDSQSFENIHNLYLILKPFTESVEEHLKQLYVETENLKRENTFRPLFLHYFENTMHRARAIKFRICLAENGFDLHVLRALWRDKRQEGLTSALRSLDGLTPKQRIELVELLDSYFDPRKDICKPPVRSIRQRRRTQVTEETPETGDGASSDGFKSDDETPDLADLASSYKSSNSKTLKHTKEQSDKPQKKSIKSFMKSSTSDRPKSSQLLSKR